jgi:hypothetical protein
MSVRIGGIFTRPPQLKASQASIPFEISALVTTPYLTHCLSKFNNFSIVTLYNPSSGVCGTRTPQSVYADNILAYVTGYLKAGTSSTVTLTG